MGSFNSTIRFDDESEFDVRMSTISLSGSWLINNNLSARGGLGIIRDGSMKSPAKNKNDISPGGMVSVGIEYIFMHGEGFLPFIDFSSFLSMSFTKTQDVITKKKTNYLASDLRLGSRAAWNINNNIFPYIAVRVFGGPVNWEIDDKGVIGSDVHHYQFALGTAVRISDFSLYGEWAGIGEQALNVGLGLSL